MKDKVYFLFCLSTAMVGHAIHGSVFWSIVDYCLPQFAWGKWLILCQVNRSVLHHAFGFLAN